MRFKSYYMPDEITTNLYTAGKQFQLADGTEYLGLYHLYITNEVYTGATWDSKTSKRLFAYVERDSNTSLYKKLKEKLRVKFIKPFPHKPFISKQNVDAGYIDRYFIRKLNESIVLEIDESQYNLWNSKKIDTNVYFATSISWFISGPIEDEVKVNSVKQGVRSKNLKQIQVLKQNIPEIENIITSPLQYYTDANFVVPKDINK